MFGEGYVSNGSIKGADYKAVYTARESSIGMPMLML